MRPIVAVIDYGMGNLRSVGKALELSGARTEITASSSRIKSADAIVLPGVGSFGPAIKNLKRAGIDDTILEAVGKGRPFLGLCLGFQLLFDASSEDGLHKGLGIIPGKVVKFRTKLKVPHMGWNSIRYPRGKARPLMFDGIPENSFFYFVHSYYAAPSGASEIAGITGYGSDFCSAVTMNRVWGCQFHPEKSSGYGLQLLKNFVNII
ncbi:MAG: imidazole glycerol phosphate synthase subunit HisH [Elusimicrobiota bacterium]